MQQALRKFFDQPFEWRIRPDRAREHQSALNVDQGIFPTAPGFFRRYPTLLRGVRKNLYHGLGAVAELALKEYPRATDAEKIDQARARPILIKLCQTFGAALQAKKRWDAAQA